MDDAIIKDVIIRRLNNMTVNTNPDDYEGHENFMSFMDDPEISSFGRWQWSNGYNTALVAVETGLASASFTQPKLSKDDVETIRIGLQAELEDLCNQGRWNEAKEQQGLIDRFKAFFW